MRIVGFIVGAIVGAAGGVLIQKFAGSMVAGFGPLGAVLVYAVPSLVGAVLFSSWFKATGRATHGHPLRVIILALIFFAVVAGALILIALSAR